MKKTLMFLVTILIIGFAVGWFTFVPVLGKVPEIIKNNKSPKLTYNGPWAASMKVGGPNASAILRAIVANTGLGANSSDEAVYWVARTDSTGERLRGGHTYEIRFDQAPTIEKAIGFWSLCVYNSKDFFIPNSMKRYNLGDRSPLIKNADGSFTIYLSPTQPKDISNWLRSLENEEPVVLTIRMYAPLPEVLKQPDKSPMPKIVRIEKNI
jgi:hypothetical protein